MKKSVNQLTEIKVIVYAGVEMCIIDSPHLKCQIESEVGWFLHVLRHGVYRAHIRHTYQVIVAGAVDAVHLLQR